MGGYCPPIDPSYLSWRVERTLGQRFRFVELANAINSYMPDYVVRRLLLGMEADVRAADPLVTEAAVLAPAVARVHATPAEIAAADIVVLLTDHDAFRAADVGHHARYALDCRRVRSGPNVDTL